MQSSDLFGQEILPESTFESEYGKLTLKGVVVPDFSSDEIGAACLKKEFDNLKSFLEENDLSKKRIIASKIFENEFSWEDTYSEKSETFSEFIRILKASILARLFETGYSLNNQLCREFGYEQYACLSSGMVCYNDSPVIQPFSCAGGIYAYCLKYVLNQDIFCPPDYIDLRDEIINEGIPTHNYLSWAFSQASNNIWIILFASENHIWLC